MSFPADVCALLAERFELQGFDYEGPLVPRERLVELATCLRDELGYIFFVTVASVHYPEVAAIPADEEKSTEATPGSPDCTLVLYRVRRLPSGDRPTDTFPFRIFVPTGESTPSLVPVWAGADWQEREQYDLVGTLFADHPDLRRIMMPEDWKGHPLRRDFAIDTPHFPWR
jgi:NADH-quinone oxidoreductase subunit C